MSTALTSGTITEEEKVKVAYALNLCATSITQIIDSRDLVVMKQERELILGNLNLRNFVKHPALLDVIKQILNAITYFEIQAGDLSFIEREYQKKLKNAIWEAVPSPSVLFSGGGIVSTAVMVATQVGIGYMNYRKNKNQYLLDKEKSEWELRKHEIEQLNSLRNLLFETAWKLSADYDFNDEFRLTERQINRYSAALLEENPLKRFERLDVMSDKFAAFPPFWYHKGNAAMEVYRSEQYSAFAPGYRDEALRAYGEFHNRHFEFLREDVVAASCCMEHISLLEPGDAAHAGELLCKAMRLAGDNYDILQQSIFVNLQLGNIDGIVAPLREMIANGYNVGLNGILLSRIYFTRASRMEYEKLRAIAGEDNVLPWSQNSGLSEKQLIDACKARISDEYQSMVKRIAFKLLTGKPSAANSIYKEYTDVSVALLKYTYSGDALAQAFGRVDGALKQAVVNANEKTLSNLSEEAQRLETQLRTAELTMQIAEDALNLMDHIREVARA